MTDRKFLFEYRFDGDVYGMTVDAPDIETARRKASAMGLAIYKGEVAATIALRPPRWWSKWLS